MRTTLKTLICAALCCAASSVFAVAPPGTTTSIAFGYPDCNTHVGSVSLTGDTNPDVYVQTHTTLTVGGGDVTDGKVHLFIATDGLGNVVSVANNVLWVNLSGSGQDVDGTGHACFPLDLENLSAFGLNPVTCATGLVGFQGQYIGQGSAGNSTVEMDLTIQCAGCGTNTNFTIGLEQTDGPGSPCPGTYHCWTYILAVQNCTDSDLTNVKIQGGTSAWIDTGATVTADNGFIVTNVANRGGHNQVFTLNGALAQGATVHVTVHVCGRVSRHCGDVMYLSGPWSSTGTKVSDGSKVTTGYAGRAAAVVDCDTGTCQP
jgi:hypothetical protein